MQDDTVQSGENKRYVRLLLGRTNVVLFLVRRLTWILIHIEKLICGVRWHGRRMERLSGTSTPVIFAANHCSHMDTPIIQMCLPGRYEHTTIVLASKEVFGRRSQGSLLVRFRQWWVHYYVVRAFMAIPLYRSRNHREWIRQAEQVLKGDRNLLIYPEGTRSRDGRMNNFRTGVGLLAIRTGVPVVPVHVSGTSGVLPPGAKWPRPGNISVTCGSPIIDQEQESAVEFTSRIQHSVNSLETEVESDDSVILEHVQGAD